MNFEIRQSANTATVNTQSFFPFFSWWNPLFEVFFSSWEECVIYYVKVLTTTGEDQCKNLNPPPCAEIMSGEINLHLELFLPPGVATTAWLTHFWDLEENFLAPKTTPRSNPCAVFRRRRGSSLISLPSGWQFFPLDFVCHLGKKIGNVTRKDPWNRKKNHDVVSGEWFHCSSRSHKPGSDGFNRGQIPLLAGSLFLFSLSRNRFFFRTSSEA